METPNILVEKVKQGKVVLFLGSGALYGATLPNKEIPLGQKLRDILCDEYLNESFKQSELAHVAAMAISRSGLFEVQDFIKEYFSGLIPAEFHNQIPLFKWRAIFTTNYDLLIETIYASADNTAQALNVVISNEDHLDETRSTNEKLAYLKLHGCVTRTHDSSLPLILTTDQYNESYASRKRLFNQLYELAYENTVVFVGHSLLDHNIRYVMLQLEKESAHGQRHYLLKPGVDDIERDFWGQKKITALDITFQKFIEDICNKVSVSDRTLALIRPPSTHPIKSVFVTHTNPSDELIDYLTNQVEWVNKSIPFKSADPKEFFHGMDQDWFPIVNEVCIKRELSADILESALLAPDAERIMSQDFYVIKGEAGSGKSILLRQLAWRIAQEALGVALWVKADGAGEIDLIEELISKSNERVFLFWDDAAANVIALSRFILKSRKKNSRVTVVTAERYNEWNVRCEELDQLITKTFELKYLSEKEIDDLVCKLEKYDCLGPNLSGRSHAARCQELKEVHGRQLLVALHEATMGRPFEDIIFDEYENIYPDSAKKIYLTVCTLNRLKIPVRAGLMSRIHEISFTDFTEKLYKPLEKVVITKGSSDQDVHYHARHSEIAEIVFRRALSDVNERFQEYISIINKLNISFSSDKASFRALIRAKSLVELFPSYEDVAAIYRHAMNSVGDDPYLLQQMANFERLRPNGSLDKALDLLLIAKEAAPYDSSILHTLSVVWRDKAKKSNDFNIRKKCRSEARGYLERISSKWGMSGHLSTSMIELSIDALKDLLEDSEVLSTSVREAIRNVQHELTENKRQYPSEGHLHSLEATFAKLIDDHERAFTALERSFEENDREPYLAIRLATSYLGKNDPENAKRILQLALERRRGDHKLNFHYAELLRISFRTTAPEELLYYYRRAFTPNDGNYQAQFWFARFAYLSQDSNNHTTAKNIFDSLRKARLPHASKVEIREHEGKEKITFFEGVVKKKRVGFGFLRMDGSGYEIFFPASEVLENMWEAINEGDRVRFNIGYSYSGVVGCNISC